MADSEEFKVAAEHIRNLTAAPAQEAFMKLYSLYKQATCGDCNIECPSDEKGKVKFEAWTAQKGKSKDDAAKEYIEYSKQFE